MNNTAHIFQILLHANLKKKIFYILGVFGPHGQLIVINVYSAKNESYKKVDVYQLLPPDKDLDWIEFMKFTGPFILSVYRKSINQVFGLYFWYYYKFFNNNIFCRGETHVNTVSNFLRSYASISSTTSEKLLYLLIDLIIKLRGVCIKYKITRKKV